MSIEKYNCFLRKTMSPNPPIGSRDRVQTRLIFTVLIVSWPWKFDQGHQNLISSFNYPSDNNIKFGQNPSVGSSDRVQTSCFGQNLTFKVLVWPWKWGQGHQNLTISFSSLMWCFYASLVKKNPPIGSGDRVQTRPMFSLYSVVTLKIRSRSNHFF